MKKEKPLKSKRLKVIDYKGILYATFNGSAIWKIDKVAFGILRSCNGKKTLDQIIRNISRRIDHKPKDVKPVIENILKELTKMDFVEWVES